MHSRPVMEVVKRPLQLFKKYISTASVLQSKGTNNLMIGLYLAPLLPLCACECCRSCAPDPCSDEPEELLGTRSGHNLCHLDESQTFSAMS